MMKFILLLLGAALISPCYASYKIEDLRLSLKKKRFEEFFEHVSEVPPSKRKESWEQVLVSAGVQYANHLLITSPRFQSFHTLQELAEKFSELKEEEFFIRPFSKLGLDLLSLGNKKEDKNIILSLTHQIPLRPYVQTKLMKKLSSRQDLVSLQVLTRKILTSSQSESFCRDKTLFEILSVNQLLSKQTRLSSRCLSLLSRFISNNIKDFLPKELIRIYRRVLISTLKYKERLFYIILSFILDDLSSEDLTILRDKYSYLLKDLSLSEKISKKLSLIVPLPKKILKRNSLLNHKILTSLLAPLSPYIDSILRNCEEKPRSLCLEFYKNSALRKYYFSKDDIKNFNLSKEMTPYPKRARGK